jgi:hypothetical protein
LNFYFAKRAFKCRRAFFPQTFQMSFNKKNILYFKTLFLLTFLSLIKNKINGISWKNNTFIRLFLIKKCFRFIHSMKNLLIFQVKRFSLKKIYNKSSIKCHKWLGSHYSSRALWILWTLPYIKVNFNYCERYKNLNSGYWTSRWLEYFNI